MSTISVTADASDVSIGMATILQMLFSQLDLTPKWDALQQRIAVNPGDAVALHDASQILQGLGKTDEALAMLDRALKLRRDYCVVHGTGRGPRILAFVTPGDFMANTPLDFLLSGSDAVLLIRYVDAQTRTLRDVPEHDVAIVAIAESESNAAVLHRLGGLLQEWKRPVLNGRTETIANLTRDGVAALFADEPTLLSPATWRVTRSQLTSIASDLKTLAEVIDTAEFPIIIRPIGTHAGGGLDRLTCVADLVAYLPTQSADAFYISPFIDYSGPDGRFTKLRIVQIAGRPFASHLAVSDNWIVHYLSAGMAEDTAKREIEADWMATFDTDFARRHGRSFERLYAKLGLDYFGYDCAELPDGRLLLFEVDVAMVVHDMDSAELYPYKKPAMRKLFDAFLDMIEARSRMAVPAPGQSIASAR
jgi:hypothetical protein